MADEPTTGTIKIPTITFEVGERKISALSMLRGKDVRPLYGPENEHGRRPLVGVVLAESVERLSSMLDYADATMPKDNDEQAPPV